MEIIEMVEWERNICKNMSNLIFKFSSILIGIHLVILYYLHVYNMYHDYFKSGTQGEYFKTSLDKNELSLSYCLTM